MRLLPNGNVEITVQLLPDTYAALKAATERDGFSNADLINAAIQAYDHLSKLAAAADTPPGGDAPQ